MFEGGEGVTRGGSEERSRESGVEQLDDFDMPFVVGDAVGDAGGVMVEDAIMISDYFSDVGNRAVEKGNKRRNNGKARTVYM